MKPEGRLFGQLSLKRNMKLDSERHKPENIARILGFGLYPQTLLELNRMGGQLLIVDAEDYLGAVRELRRHFPLDERSA